MHSHCANHTLTHFNETAFRSTEAGCLLKVNTRAFLPFFLLDRYLSKISIASADGHRWF